MNPSPLHETNPRHERYWLLGIVIWVSFVTASIATALFFATFDPLDIMASATYPLDWERTTCYSVGFLLFWTLTAATSSIVAWLISTPAASVAAIRQIKRGES